MDFNGGQWTVGLVVEGGADDVSLKVGLVGDGFGFGGAWFVIGGAWWVSPVILFAMFGGDWQRCCWRCICDCCCYGGGLRERESIKRREIKLVKYLEHMFVPSQI